MKSRTNQIIRHKSTLAQRVSCWEEFPLADKDLKREGGKWILRTVIHSLEGAGRFVIGLAADVKILEGDALRKYILDYQKKYIQKL